jgi:hypothetical protein
MEGRRVTASLFPREGVRASPAFSRGRLTSGHVSRLNRPDNHAVAQCPLGFANPKASSFAPVFSASR